MPKVVVLGGPNGAGKSTVAPELLRNALGLKEFVNADQIASGLSAFNTEAVAFEAGRIMLRRLHELAAERSSFAFESTLASRTFHLFLRQLKAGGYQVLIYYVALNSPELALARVEHRVKMGCSWPGRPPPLSSQPRQPVSALPSSCGSLAGFRQFRRPKADKGCRVRQPAHHLPEDQMATSAGTGRKRTLAKRTARLDAVERAMADAVKRARRQAAAEGLLVPVQRLGERTVRWIKP